MGLADYSLLTGVVLGMFYVGGYLFSRMRRVPLKQNAEAVFAVFAALGALGFALLKGEHPVYSLQYWLAVMLIERAFLDKGKRDYGFCFLVAAALFAHISRTYSDLPFLVYAVGFCFLTPYAMFHFLVVYGSFRKGEEGMCGKVKGLRWNVGYMTMLSLVLMSLTALVFMVIPRPPGSAFSIKPREKSVTGFSSEVTLGDFDSIVEQRQVVMVVETDKPRMWRGGTFETYRDGSWQRGIQSEPIPARVFSRRDIDEADVRRRFYMFNTDWTAGFLFTGGYAVAARTGMRSWRIYRYPDNGTLRLRRRRFADTQGEYEVASIEGDVIHYSRNIPRNMYLQLPGNLSVRIRQLANDITRNAITVEEKTAAIHRYLTRAFSYSLTDLDSGGMEPLDYFLFENRKGHCEYFATAAAILLRCNGIPSRVVQGFAPGALVDNRYVVRLSDAHLWTEAYVDGVGWITVDATPAAEGGGSRSQRRIPGLIEKLQLRWYTSVLLYDGETQLSILRFLLNLGSELYDSMKAVLNDKSFARMAVLIAGFVAVVIFVGKFRFRFVFPCRKKGKRSVAESKLFRAYFRCLQRNGYKRLPGTTPHGLIEALRNDNQTIVDDARFLTDLFYRIRFGGTSLDSETERQARQALKSVSANIRQRKRAR